MANQTIIQFPDSVGGNPTKDEIVFVRRKDDDGNILSENKVQIVENIPDASSDLNMSSFIPGIYDIIFEDTVNFGALDIPDFELISALPVESDDQISDVYSFILEEDTTDSESFTHNLETTNYQVNVVSSAGVTEGEVLKNITIEILRNSVVIGNAATAGYTRYRVDIFNRGN